MDIKIKFKLAYKEYESTLNKTNACKKYSMCSKTFNKYCKDLNLKSNLHLKLKDNNILSSIDTPDKAYCLGFIAADGSVSYGSMKIPILSIKVKSTDRSVLEFIKYTLKSSHKIGTVSACQNKIEDRNSYTSEASQLQIRNAKVCNDLFLHGIWPNKTYDLKLPDLDKTLFKHWVRGFFDGDGSVSKRTNRDSIVSSFCSADLLFLQNLSYKLEEYYNIKSMVNVRTNKSASELRLNFGESKKLANIMYPDASFKLERKFRIFKKYCPLLQ